MRKIYILLLMALMMVSVGTVAQTPGYNRLLNVATGHVANLSGGSRFAPDATLQECYARPGSVAYVDFDGEKVTQLRAQGVDVVNTVVPMMKLMLLQVVTEERFAALKDSAIVRVEGILPGAMGTLLVNYINNYSYENFQSYVINLDTNLYYTEVDGGYRLFFHSPAFPINAGDFTPYFISKTNAYLSLYKGTLQEMAKTYLEGREHLIPVVNSFIKELLFADYLYLCEREDPDYGPYLGFANSTDVESTGNLVWDFVPVDDNNYIGVQAKCQDANGTWWGALAADFAFRVPEGMTAYYVADVVDATNSLIRIQAYNEEIIPALTPVILQLKGKDAATNKLSLVEGDYPIMGNYANQLKLPLDSLGLMLGFTLDEPDPHYFTLGITDGKVALKSTGQTEFSLSEPYYYLPDYYVGKVSSLTLSTDLTGIEEHTMEAKGDGRVYDLQGRRVEKPTKGIYIVDGKKVMLR